MTLPDIVIILTDEERAVPSYETGDVRAWRRRSLVGRQWFLDNGVDFRRHYVAATACVPSRPSLWTGHYPDLHGVTQTDGLGKQYDDSRLRWMRPGEVPTIGHWFRAAGYDTYYAGKWHVSHADLMVDGRPLPTNTSDGTIIADNVARYLEADPLDPYGFSGWVGPEPHGGRLRDSGLVRDPIIADRVVAWLSDRYRRRRADDLDAQRPFVLVSSFVNPHDIVLWPLWARKGPPLEPRPDDPPPIDAPPTAEESLVDKPAAQIAYRDSYPSAYGPAPLVRRAYRRGEEYRHLYYRLHLEGDGPIDRVRRAVTDEGSTEAVLVLSSDHGDLLGAHGGLHQKWFNLYDECTRVPLQIVRIGSDPTTATTVDTIPTNHIDLLPTLLGLAGLSEADLRDAVTEHHTEVHPLPGRDLGPLVDGSSQATDGSVYFMSRDNMLEGDGTASAVARARGRTHPPFPLRIRIPAHVASSFEAVVGTVAAKIDGEGHVWKVVRTHDDPDTWTEPHVRQLAMRAPGGDRYRTEPIADQWELYDLDSDPDEVDNRWRDEEVSRVAEHMRALLDTERARCIPVRNEPWPHGSRAADPAPTTMPYAPTRLLRKAARRLGFHDRGKTDRASAGCA